MHAARLAQFAISTQLTGLLTGAPPHPTIRSASGNPGSPRMGSSDNPPQKHDRGLLTWVTAADPDGSHGSRNRPVPKQGFRQNGCSETSASVYKSVQTHSDSPCEKAVTVVVADFRSHGLCSDSCQSRHWRLVFSKQCDDGFHQHGDPQHQQKNGDPCDGVTRLISSFQNLSYQRP